MSDTFVVQCPYCGERVDVYVEPDVHGRLVYDCEVCCRPWSVRVWDDDGERHLEVERSDGE